MAPLPRPQVPLPIPVVDLDAIAATVGSDWAVARVRELHAADRAVTGGWPGTLREAKGQIIAALTRNGLPAPAPERLDLMARAATAAARTCWSRHAEPDPEV
jgi:hypothetical protein